ncbi:MAG: phosphoribosyltransferase family protein [Candidatus Spechtbacterales bacterium]
MHAPEIIHRLFTFCVEAVFPASCYGCGGADTYLCDECSGIVGALPQPQCPHCGTRLPFGELPNACRAALRISRFFCCADYHNLILQKIIRDYKYGRAFALAPALSDYMRAWLANNAYANILAEANVLIVPVPSHPKRERERGFHPAGVLAESFARHMNLEYSAHALSKTRNNPPQVETKNADERRENVKGVFTLANPELIHRRTILLVDDVCTTGATLTECAKAIRTGNPKAIWALTLAKD